MAEKRTSARIGRHRIELSNLDKVLFPGEGIVKAELIHYYLKIAPTILRHIKGRPLSLVRYPDGIEGEAFFQKKRPEWAPEWIDHVVLGDGEGTDYMMAGDEASLAWLANLACVELHQMHYRAPHFDHPDYIAYDLDPPEGSPFARLIEPALDLKEHLESYGYHPFVKTTGGKGLHVVTPIEPVHTFDEVYAAASDAASAFVKRHDRTTTLRMNKQARKGRILVDIYRNRRFQTIVSPYSVRGRRGATVSMPLEWERLPEIEGSSAFHLRNALDFIEEGNDAWEAMEAYAVGLHQPGRPRAGRPPGQSAPAGKSPPLEEYAEKRDFRKTPEPAPEAASGEGKAFVVHRHHASRLHYDVRLEAGGVLRSWAVPKGLPPRPGIRRLAVAVEDHPLSYLTFEGTIPAGEYGAGRVWIFAHGRYEITREKKGSFHARLSSPELNAEYRFINTGGKDWLLELVERSQIDWLRDPVDPMLALLRSELPQGADYLYEVKWDGIRALISLDEGQLTIRSRNRRDITRYFPELLVPQKAFRAACGLFDGEIVCPDAEGKPVFEHVVGRLQQSSAGAIERAQARHPAQCFLFDCLYLDGRPILGDPFERRRDWLEDSLRPGTTYRISEAVEEGDHLYDAVRTMGLEGVMAKKRGSPYLPGKRTSIWLKIKSHQSIECVIAGYTRGKGARESTFGALQLGRYHGDALRYVGKVGGGFDEAGLKSVYSRLGKVKPGKRPVTRRPSDDAWTVWLEPELVCEVRYSSFTKEGILREPIFLRMRPDLRPEDCRDD